MKVGVPKGYALFCAPLALAGALEFVHSDPKGGWAIIAFAAGVAVWGLVRWWGLLTLRRWRVHRQQIAKFMKVDAVERMVANREMPWAQPWAALVLQHDPTLREAMPPREMTGGEELGRGFGITNSNTIRGVCGDCRGLQWQVRLCVVCHVKEPEAWLPRPQQDSYSALTGT